MIAESVAKVVKREVEKGFGGGAGGNAERLEGGTGAEEEGNSNTGGGCSSVLGYSAGRGRRASEEVDTGETRQGDTGEGINRASVGSEIPAGNRPGGEPGLREKGSYRGTKTDKW